MQFKLGRKSLLYKGRYVKLRATSFVDKSGTFQEWEYIDKSDVVCALPVTDDHKIILVKNYRVPVERYVIELPAGLIDIKGEKPEDAMKRELIEETGYQALNWHSLLPYPYRAGTSKNLVHSFIATGLTKATDATGDDTEDIVVMEVATDELVDLWLNAPDDVYFQPEIIAMYEAAIALGIIKR